MTNEEITIAPVILDGIRELITIGVGRAAGMLNQLTKAHVTLSVPELLIIDARSVKAHLPHGDELSSVVSLRYQGILNGSTALVFPHQSALNLVVILTHEDASLAEMDALRVETLIEVGNIIISAVMGSISNILISRLTYLLPVYSESLISDLTLPEQSLTSGRIILARTRFEVQERQIEGDILLVLDGDSLNRLGGRIEQMVSGVSI